jgi:hypothetical protein
MLLSHPVAKLQSPCKLPPELFDLISPGFRRFSGRPPFDAAIRAIEGGARAGTTLREVSFDFPLVPEALSIVASLDGVETLEPEVIASFVFLSVLAWLASIEHDHRIVFVLQTCLVKLFGAVFDDSVRFLATSLVYIMCLDLLKIGLPESSFPTLFQILRLAIDTRTKYTPMFFRLSPRLTKAILGQFKRPVTARGGLLLQYFVDLFSTLGADVSDEIVDQILQDCSDALCKFHVNAIRLYKTIGDRRQLVAPFFSVMVTKLFELEDKSDWQTGEALTLPAMPSRPVVLRMSEHSQPMKALPRRPKFVEGGGIETLLSPGTAEILDRILSALDVSFECCSLVLSEAARQLELRCSPSLFLYLLVQMRRRLKIPPPASIFENFFDPSVTVFQPPANWDSFFLPIRFPKDGRNQIELE